MYGYGFQGQEHDDEVKGKGNSINYKYRMHDPRIGRFFAIDPLTAKYPEWSPYAFSGNQVTVYAELEGLEPEQRLDENGNNIQPLEGEIQSGSYGDNSDLRAFRWMQTSESSSEWVDVGAVRLMDKYGGPAGWADIPKGIEDIGIGFSVFSTGSNLDPKGQGDQFMQVDKFSIDGVSYSRSKKDGGFWNAQGGMYSGMFTDDGAYAGDRFETRKGNRVFHKDAFDVTLTDDMWLEYLGEARDNMLDGIAGIWLDDVMGNDVGGLPIDPFSSSDNLLDKQIRLHLISQGPGSYMQMPLGMGWSPGVHESAAGGHLMEYWFKGYEGSSMKPVFVTKEIHFRDSMYNSNFTKWHAEK